MKKIFSSWEGTEIPSFNTCNLETIFHLTPHLDSLDQYWERIDRNIGWITHEEQEMLKSKTVSIAGCGGMGGLVATGLLRLGIGEIRLADPETFDRSNLNRQFAASLRTIGINKAIATASELRAIADDTHIVVYPMGICPETVDEFVQGSDIVCDLIEFWVVWYRILLHKYARKQKASLMNCNTVGHRTNLFLYTPDSMTIEEALGIEFDQACTLRDFAQADEHADAWNTLRERMVRAVVPDGLPEYGADTKIYSTVQAVTDRLTYEKRASIIATNPIMASGFLLNHILLYLLKDSPIPRKIVSVPPMPGFLSFCAATMTAQQVTTQWWKS